MYFRNFMLPRFAHFGMFERLGAALLLGALATAGCSPETSTIGPRGDRDGGQVLATSDGGGVLDRRRPDAGFRECTSTNTTAETVFQPVDIIWAVDSSGSMTGEAAIVQENLNNLAAAIGASGIDYRVVMITRAEYVTVPTPLGDDPERYLFLERNVQSSDSLEHIRDAYGDYGAFLRPDATTHVVVVTDDESDLRSGSFRSAMEANLGHPFTFHTVASPPGSDHCEGPLGICLLRLAGCEGPNGDAADNGDEYYDLANATGGETFSICTEDWSALFSTLTDAIAVAVALPCRYQLPDPPDGESLNRNRVNVVYTPGSGGGPMTIPYIGEGGSCSAGGWYYDGDEIVMCESTCGTLEVDEGGTVEVALGCETILI